MADLAARTNVTIKDIASVLNLSHATVSRALSDHPRISEGTKADVRRIAREMGYVPNGSAQNMRAAHSRVIGLMVPDIQNDFYASIAKIVADAAVAQGFQLALSITEDNPQRELNDLRAFVVSRAAGVIITPSETPEPETIALLKGIHAIQLVRQHEALAAEAVVIDEQAATRAATEHLIHYGHRHIAYVGTTTDLSCGEDRLAGFRMAMQHAGLEAGLVAVGAPRIEFAHRAVHGMMTGSSAPTALIIGSSRLTVGALKALRGLNLACPADVSVVGYGDPDWFELVGEGLTTVAVAVQPMGTYAIDLLLARIQGEPVSGNSRQSLASRFPATLTVRGSTRPVSG
ncbi:LacI family DNA-binding transcriptional regulator [Cupriavidus sp. AcVe19-1a]|uniref:LacI family DNA-binding transcriptional regulator n=1 Tax=Cupriavidus sp. AcVe19-1a TaxID=2821359 RepID=UPI001AE7124E|nr:LacI family DNA-binding transcriptional regulator [Cupriavidus sp. AcVe19-1a]MBP0630513.1 LacI family DNA-binding transcriptional regulator [Cupriavidus sp. AcVe19-1a]